MNLNGINRYNLICNGFKNDLINDKSDCKYSKIVLEYNLGSTHDRVAASWDYARSFSEYIGREVMGMTSADIILVFIGIIGLLVSFGSFLVALLAFLDRDNKRK